MLCKLRVLRISNPPEIRSSFRGKRLSYVNKLSVYEISYEYGVDFANFYSVFGAFFIYGQTNKNCPVLAHFLLRILKILRMRSRGLWAKAITCIFL